MGIREASDEAAELLAQLQKRDGTSAQAAQWLRRLRQIDAFYVDSHPGRLLEKEVSLWPLYDRLRTHMGERPTKSQLIALVRKIENGEGTEARAAQCLESSGVLSLRRTHGRRHR